MRVASLDLIRGVAVLGILAINIAGFAGPSINTLGPHLPPATGLQDQAAFAVSFVLFEGKMRALFAILFGASMALFIDLAEARGQDGDMLQARRLGWLMLFGALHFFLLWWGDILFAYAVCGAVVLLLHRLSPRLLACAAVVLFVTVHGAALLGTWPMVAAEEAVRLGTASVDQARTVARYHDYLFETARDEMRVHAGDYLHIVGYKLREHSFWLISGVREGFAEYVPLMIIGVLLQRSGFFAGTWPRWSMIALALVATLTGLAATLGVLAWVWPRGFPLIAMDTALRHGLALPHLAMALGYAALLVLSARWLDRHAIGRRIAAAGRMAFSNYLGTSLVMTAVFYGWGLGLFGRFGPLVLWGFVLLAWALMLGASTLWLRHYRRGPLEWAWRSLSTGTWLKNRM